MSFGMSSHWRTAKILPAGRPTLALDRISRGSRRPVGKLESCGLAWGAANCTRTLLPYTKREPSVCGMSCYFDGGRHKSNARKPPYDPTNHSPDLGPLSLPFSS